MEIGPSNSSSAESGPETRSILVVEDDDDVRAMITGMLEAEGMIVVAASNGTVALTCAAARWPAVLVLDMGMPWLGGTGLVAALRAQFGKIPPIVLVTGDGAAARKARQVGAFYHLKKPFDMDELISAVKEGLAAT